MKIKASLLLLFYQLSGFVPRRRNLWLLGDSENKFGGNAKYLFLWLANNQSNVTPVWISGDPEVVTTLRKRGYQASRRNSILGIWLQLRAACYIFCDWPWDVGIFYSKRAFLVNLWHGSGLKQIAFGNPSSALHRETSTMDVMTRARTLGSTKVADVFIATSPVIASRFVNSFKIHSSRAPVIGSPRLDCSVDENLRTQALAFDDPSTWMAAKADYDEIYVYAPTYRSGDEDALATAFPSLDELNRVLRNRNAVMFVKLHPKRQLVDARITSHVKPWPKSIDIYLVLDQVDCLITDYSSIMFDYLSLKSAGILLYPFDLDEYASDRGLYFPYCKSVVGTIVTTPQKALSAIADGSALSELDGEKLAEVRERVWAGSSVPSSSLVAQEIWSRLERLGTSDRTENYR